MAGERGLSPVCLADPSAPLPPQGECLTLPDLPQKDGHLPICTLATCDHMTPTAPIVSLPTRTGPRCALADCDNQDTENSDLSQWSHPISSLPSDFTLISEPAQVQSALPLTTQPQKCRPGQHGTPASTHFLRPALVSTHESKRKGERSLPPVKHFLRATWAGLTDQSKAEGACHHRSFRPATSW